MPISGVDPTPRPTAVYASNAALPRRPQDSLPSCLLGFGRTRLALASSHQLLLSHPASGSHLGCLTANLPYAVQPLGHAFPVLSPVRAVLTRVPLGPRPSLPRLRRRLPVVVRRLRRCRVGGGRAFALPPSARSNGSCGFPASRFPVWSSPLTGDDPDPRHQMDQPDQSELVHQT